MNIDYSKSYLIYRKMPLFAFIGTMILAFIWGIIDSILWITNIGLYEFGGFLLWLLIGFIVASLNFASTVLLISPTIVRTDATLNILREIKSKRDE